MRLLNPCEITPERSNLTDKQGSMKKTKEEVEEKERNKNDDRAR